jgi:predicted ABC-type ATPase
MFSVLDSRPIIVALAGPNGAGKTTFYNAHLKACGLRFLSADLFVQEPEIGAYEAAQIVTALRHKLVKQRESFVFETVFSDPVQEKLAFLKQAEQQGYTVVLCFVGLADPRSSEARVAMRVSQGGHSVPLEKLVSRFPRIQANLKAAIRELQHVFVFDNEDLRIPFRHVAVFEKGHLVFLNKPVPQWLQPMLP